jgi:hypothetical protein
VFRACAEEMESKDPIRFLFCRCCHVFFHDSLPLCMSRMSDALGRYSLLLALGEADKNIAQESLDRYIVWASCEA